MNLIFFIMAGMAAGGVVRAVLNMRQQAKEHQLKKENLEKFEREHPGK